MQGEPTSPRIWKISCSGKSAKIEWISSFNGGDSQTFFALGLIGQHEVTRSEFMKDRGENKIHHTELQNLQPSTKYVFYVVAINRHGNSSSNQMECTTLAGIILENIIDIVFILNFKGDGTVFNCCQCLLNASSIYCVFICNFLRQNYLPFDSAFSEMRHRGS